MRRAIRAGASNRDSRYEERDVKNRLESRDADNEKQPSLSVQSAFTLFVSRLPESRIRFYSFRISFLLLLFSYLDYSNLATALLSF